MTLLLDALDRVLLEPHCAVRWHGLMATWEASPDQAARRAVLDALRKAPAGDPRSDVLRLTFLARASGDSRYENAAVARALTVEPDDPDRLAAFMAFRWLSALQDLDGRSDFTTALAVGLLPEMAARLMRNAGSTIPPGFVPRVPEAIHRVAVVVPYIGHRFHTPSMMAVEQCAVLAREGRRVRLFSAQELAPPDAALFRGDGRVLNLPPLNTKGWGAILPAGVDMTISDDRLSLMGRWRTLMPVLAGFDPDVVLLVGLYSPLAAALHQIRPVVGISVNTVPPIAPLDVWLTANPEERQREVWGGVFRPPLPVFHPWRIRRPARQFEVTRAEFGGDAARVIWVTAGFRLHHEIKDDWANRMLQLMLRYPAVVWLLVGGDGELPEALRHAPPDRVRALATRHDLPGIFRCSDIYVNPPRMGGGFSVAEAMAESLPVVSLADSDGGDKVGELALPDIDTYLDRLAVLTESRSLRAETGEAMRRRFAERFDIEASGASLLAAFQQAATLARGRLTGAS